MNDDSRFNSPKITDEEIHWVSRLLDLEEDAFYGKDGTDPRQEVLKYMETVDVAACPGSGKTTLLVAKLAILAEKWQYRTRGICVLSHTNAARHEIETHLGNTTAGRRLLSYPHYLGTIHGFVNEFLAVPWLQSKGFQIKMIDDDVVESRRRRLLKRKEFSALKTYVERNETQANFRQNVVKQWFVASSDFLVLQPNGDPVFKRDVPSGRQLEKLVKYVVCDGYHRHGEMFMWARDLMHKAPDVIAVIRNRFPLLFIDEAQDNSEEQSEILHRIFLAGNGAVIRQRFGDENQAIFDSTLSKEAKTDKFPISTIRQDLPNSHRFGQTIANMADPLGLIPYGLKGQGPRKLLSSGALEERHTIFMIDDECAINVIDAYGELLIDTFSEEELLVGTFAAVGQIHRPSEDGNHKFPHHVRHYWPEYDAELTGADPKPHTFVQYIFSGQGKAQKTGESYPAVKKIAEGILRLAGMTEGGVVFRSRKHSHRYILEQLEETADIQERYQDLIEKIAVEGEVLTKQTWDNIWCSIVREIAATIAKAKLSDEESDNFLAWRDGPGDSAPSAIDAQKSNDNIYRFTKDGKKVAIRVGSIHSVKGETHTATLVLETYWQGKNGRHNLELLMPWLDGSTSGGDKALVYQKSRLKLHYVAMTRPTHLLCLAMKRSTFEDDKGVLDQVKIQKLQKCGWQIKSI